MLVFFFVVVDLLLICEWKKRSQETQTLRAGCSKAEPKNFAPPQTPFSGARDGQNLISWRWSLPSPINPVWWGSMHAISSYCGNRPTHTHTHIPTHKQTRAITIHCASASAQCNKDGYNGSFSARPLSSRKWSITSGLTVTTYEYRQSRIVISPRNYIRFYRKKCKTLTVIRSTTLIVDVKMSLRT